MLLVYKYQQWIKKDTMNLKEAKKVYYMWVFREEKEMGMKEL